MTYPLHYRLIAEFAGTAMLVLFGAGSVVAALSIGGGTLSYAGLGFVALTFAIVIAVVIHSLGHVSGAHISPAVTFALAVTRRFTWSEAGPYLVAQLLGGAVGALVIVAMFGSGAVYLGGVGGTALGGGASFGSGVIAEVVGTFILVFTIMAVAVDSRAAKGWAAQLAVYCIGPLLGAAAAALSYDVIAKPRAAAEEGVAESTRQES